MTRRPAPADLGIRCRHRRRKSKRLGLCPRCTLAYRRVVRPAHVAALEARRRRARALAFLVKVRAAKAALMDRSRWRRRNAALVRRYGLTIFQFNAMLRHQRWRCAVCLRAAAALYVDHEHGTGRVRGILCYRCNRGLGMFRDDADAVRRAAEYLACHGYDAREHYRSGLTAKGRRDLERWERAGGRRG